MPYNVEPFMDLDEANEILEELGVFGATKKPNDRTLRLYGRRRKRIDPDTREAIFYRPEDQMTSEIKSYLESLWWRVDMYHSSQWTEVWQG